MFRSLNCTLMYLENDFYQNKICLAVTEQFELLDNILKHYTFYY